MSADEDRAERARRVFKSWEGTPQCRACIRGTVVLLGENGSPFMVPVEAVPWLFRKGGGALDPSTWKEILSVRDSGRVPVVAVVDEYVYVMAARLEPLSRGGVS